MEVLRKRMKQIADATGFQWQTVALIGYGNANAVPKRKIAAENKQ
jgi:hypothetical protein